MLPRLRILIVFGPLAVWLAGMLLLAIVLLGGCEVMALGPQECIVFGRDIGEDIYPLWSLGFFFPIVILWVAISSLVIELARWIIARTR